MHENHFLFAFNVPKSRYRMMAPLAAALLVTSLVLIMQNNLALGTGPLKLTLLPAPGGAMAESVNSRLLMPFTWVSTALAVSVIFIATILISYFVVMQILQDAGSRWQWAAPAAILGLTACLSLAIILMIGPGSAMDGIMEAIFPNFVSLQRPPFTFFMDGLAIWETLMLIASFCFLCMPIASKTPALIQLSRRSQYCTLLLNLGAFTLAIGVIQFNLLFRLISPAAINKMSVLQMDALAAGLALILGTYSSLLLAALYVPTALILAAETHKLAFSMGKASSPEQQRLWVKENGLTFPGHYGTGRIIALLAPVLTGWLGEPLVKAIGTLLSS
jgi:hypothetical protein